MKKILLTTTALVAFAGAASADVAISGYAEMGIAGGSGVETQFHQDIDVTFSMTGETDSGLSFGASVDLDETAAGTNNSDDNGTTVFISGGFGTLTMGDTDGAADWALTEAGNVGNPGSLADDETGHSGYLGSYFDGAYDGQIVRYDNTFGDFGVAVSLEMDDSVGGNSNGYALGLKYNLDLSGTTVALGLGYQSATSTAAGYSLAGVTVGSGVDIDGIALSAAATFDNGLSAGLVYTSFDIGGLDGNHIGLGLGYTTGALSLHANYGQYDVDFAGKQSGYGLAVGYDLGGGASVLAAYGHSDNNYTSAVSSNTFSAGLALSF